MIVALVDAPLPSQATATALLSIYFARRVLRRRIPDALAGSDQRVLARLYMQRDELARIAMRLQRQPAGESS